MVPAYATPVRLPIIQSVFLIATGTIGASVCRREMKCSFFERQQFARHRSRAFRKNAE